MGKVNEQKILGENFLFESVFEGRMHTFIALWYLKDTPFRLRNIAHILSKMRSYFVLEIALNSGGPDTK